MRSAIIEGAALFSAVTTLVTGNILPAALIALCTVVLIVRRPSKQEFMGLMNPGRL